MQRADHPDFCVRGANLYHDLHLVALGGGAWCDDQIPTQAPHRVMASTEETIYTVRRIEDIPASHGLDVTWINPILDLLGEVAPPRRGAFLLQPLKTPSTAKQYAAPIVTLEG